MSNIEQMRKEYEARGLSEQDLDANPFRQFKLWFDEAVTRCPADWIEPNAMTLATTDRFGMVTCRTVLLKHFDERSFTFFTNYKSEKGRQIADNSRVCMLFHWPYQGRQIRIDGTASTTPREISATYFRSRPRGSQIGAWVSHQSQVAPDRKELDRQFQVFSERFEGKPIPLPDHWGGYSVTPVRIEFWQGRVDRLHDRFRFQILDSGQWQLDRLYP